MIRATARQFGSRPSVRSPRPVLVAPKVARLMGLGDYCVVQPNGARVCYAGTDPNSTNTTPPPNPPLFPDGTLVAATGTSPVYLIQNGKKAWIPNGNTLYALGYAPQEIKYIDASLLAQIPTAAPLPSITIQSSNTASQTGATTSAPPPAPPPVASTPVTTPAQTAQQPSNYIGTPILPDTTAAAPATFDISSPSTWPMWVWLALAAGATWLLVFKRR